MLFAIPSLAQTEPLDPPDLAPSVNDLLSQSFLKPEELRAIRLDHGAWTDDDLTTPAEHAQAALTTFAIADASLTDPATPAIDRAAALQLRGDPAAALALLGDDQSARALHIRVAALIALGKFADIAPLAPRASAIIKDSARPAADTAQAVRAMLLITHVLGPNHADVVGYQGMLDALAAARDTRDRLCWQAFLAEALLLHEKGRYQDAGAALDTAMSLNPRAAESWSLFGQILVDGLEFPKAEGVAARLDVLAGGVSPDAAIIRSRVQLRQTEGDAAMAALAPALVAFPNHRDLRAAEAAAAAGSFKFDLCKAKLDAFDTLAPGSPDAYLAAGKAMAEARQYAEAADYLRVASQRAPNWVTPVVELGLSELQAGHNDASLAALETATALDPYNVRADNSLTLLRELATYATIESPHFIIRYKPGIDEVLAKEMPGPLERSYARVTGNGPGGIDHSPAHKTVVELYPDHRWFGVRITGMPALHTIAAATGPVIAMEAPRDGPNHLTGPYDWARVVQHEFTHTVTLSRTRNRLPHWFTEASAVYLEDSPRDYNTVQLLTRSFDTDTLLDFDNINIAFARPKRPSDRGLAYAEGAFMYQYIIERFGPRKPLELMDLYATGVREQPAFEKVLGVTRDQFYTDFKAWGHDQLVTWGMLSSDAAPDIQALLAAERKADPNTPDEPTPALFAKWLAANPTNPFVLEQVLQASLQGRSADIKTLTPEQIDLAERYAKARPVDPLPHRLLAAHYLASDTPAAAIPHLEYLDAREQHSGAYAVELAKQYLAAGDTTKAAEKTARATTIAPYDPAIREFAATTYLRLKDLDGAARQIETMVILEPDRARNKERLEAIKKLIVAPR
jgi:tetratricopeptide (TPR) repeat protein